MEQPDIKPGIRLRSAGGAEVIVVKAPSAPVVVACGGGPMEAIHAGAPPAGSSADTDAAGEEVVLVGKRYADEELGIELLCTRSGLGPLTADGVPLAIKGTKLLPSSD